MLGIRRIHCAPHMPWVSLIAAAHVCNVSPGQPATFHIFHQHQFWLQSSLLQCSMLRACCICQVPVLTLRAGRLALSLWIRYRLAVFAVSDSGCDVFCMLADGRSRSEMFVRMRPDFSAVAARTHVSDSAVPWRGASASYDQVNLSFIHSLHVLQPADQVQPGE